MTHRLAALALLMAAITVAVLCIPGSRCRSDADCGDCPCIEGYCSD